MTNSEKYDVAVIGLGYVGLTFATVLSEIGLRVVGIEKRIDLVERTNRGVPHFSEPGLEKTLKNVTSSGHLFAAQEFNRSQSSDIYVITVGTPLDSHGVARLDMIESATTQVAANMNDGALVILRSTVQIGTSREVVEPILARTGKSYSLAMCPERTLEGKALTELRELPQVVGADTQEVRDRCSRFFRKITHSVTEVESLEAAEIVKLVDNTYRDVQFGFANEVAKVCETFGVNAYDVISAGKLGYPRTNVASPGLVGGPCLEKDPHILCQSMEKRHAELYITKASRWVNEIQPEETVRFIAHKLSERGVKEESSIALLGMAFKGQPATDDLRGSMSLKVLNAIVTNKPDAKIRVFDPVIEVDVLIENVEGVTVCQSIDEAVRDVNVTIIANNHPELKRYSPKSLGALMAPGGFVYDYWNNFSNLTKAELGGDYFALGNIGGMSE